MKEKIKHFSLLTVSTLIMAVGTYFFKFTNNFTFGGITGLAVLVADKTSISASDFSFIVNMLLLILGFIVLGKKFAAKTAYCSILLVSCSFYLWNEYVRWHHPLDRPDYAGTLLCNSSSGTRICDSCLILVHPVVEQISLQ